MSSKYKDVCIKGKVQIIDSTEQNCWNGYPDDAECRVHPCTDIKIGKRRSKNEKSNTTDNKCGTVRQYSGSEKKRKRNCELGGHCTTWLPHLQRKKHTKLVEH